MGNELVLERLIQRRDTQERMFNTFTELHAMGRPGCREIAEQALVRLCDLQGQIRELMPQSVEVSILGLHLKIGNAVAVG